mgnify:CR=1 FL=1
MGIKGFPPLQEPEPRIISWDHTILRTKRNKVEVKPKIVIEVAYEEIKKSPSYSSGWALRFPRCIKIRDDKSLNEASNIKDVKRQSQYSH